MGGEVFDAAYAGSADTLYAEIRREAFGEDIGQFSWLTADEQRAFCEWLELGAGAEVLEVACGSGGPGLFMVETTGASLTGVDIHEGGVAAATAAARARGLGESARFLVVDGRERLPFDDGSFDAIVCVDAINHFYERGRVFADWFRLLRSGGRVLFTDAATVSGLVRREELAARSQGMGEFIFTPQGVDEQLLLATGFVDVRTEDLTADAARVAAQWRDARARRSGQLDILEGAERNAAMQEMLQATAQLAAERRVTRFAYVAERG